MRSLTLGQTKSPLNPQTGFKTPQKLSTIQNPHYHSMTNSYQLPWNNQNVNSFYQRLPENSRTNSRDNRNNLSQSPNKISRKSYDFSNFNSNKSHCFNANRQNQNQPNPLFRDKLQTRNQIQRLKQNANPHDLKDRSINLRLSSGSKKKGKLTCTSLKKLDPNNKSFSEYSSKRTSNDQPSIRPKAGGNFNAIKAIRQLFVGNDKK